MKMNRNRIFYSIFLLGIFLSGTAIATKLPKPCQTILAEIMREFEAVTTDPNILYEDMRDWEIGTVALEIYSAREQGLRVNPKTLPRFLSNYPRAELQQLILDIEAAGGAVYETENRGGITDGSFGFDPESKPFLLLTEQNNPHRALEILRHERTHFELWREFRDCMLQQGDSLELASRTARELLSSPEGVHFDESRAMLAGLRSYERGNPFRSLEGLVFAGNYPAFKSLLQAVNLRRFLSVSSESAFDEMRQRLEENITQYRQRIVDRTSRTRLALANYFLSRTRTSEATLQSQLRIRVQREGLNAQMVEGLPEELRNFTLALQFRLAPQNLEDYFGSSLNEENAANISELQTLFFR